jgi:hypothetical protein
VLDDLLPGPFLERPPSPDGALAAAGDVRHCDKVSGQTTISRWTTCTGAGALHLPMRAHGACVSEHVDLRVGPSFRCSE